MLLLEFSSDWPTLKICCVFCGDRAGGVAWFKNLTVPSQGISFLSQTIQVNPEIKIISNETRIINTEIKVINLGFSWVYILQIPKRHHKSVLIKLT